MFIFKSFKYLKVFFYYYVYMQIIKFLYCLREWKYQCV